MLLISLAGCAPSHEASLTPLEQLARDTGVKWVVVNDEGSAVPSFLGTYADAGFALDGRTPEVAARAFFAKYGGIFKMTNPAAELQLDTTRGPGLFPSSYARFTQVENGTPVLDSGLSVQFRKSGHLSMVSASYFPGLTELDTHPTLLPSDAVRRATADMPSHYPAGSIAPHFSNGPPRLVIDPRDEPAALVYVFLVEAPLASADPNAGDAADVQLEYSVDAKTGVIRRAEDPSKDLAPPPATVVTASGTDYNQQSVSFPAIATGAPSVPPFFMETLGPIPTSRIVSDLADGIVHSDSLTTWDTDKLDPGSAINAYVNFGLVDEWWAKRGRLSFDNAGSAIWVFLRDPGMTSGIASWHPAVDPDPDAGTDGSPETFHFAPSRYNAVYGAPLGPPVTALDVIAHEFQHAVNQSAIGLGRDEEAPVLEEHIADVFGELVEHELGPPGADPAVMGEAMLVGGIRNLEHPGMSLIPASTNTHDGTFVACPPFKEDGTDEYKLARYACLRRDLGVPDNAWYLATFGGENDWSHLRVDSSIAMGWKDSETLYRTIIDFRVPDPTTGLNAFAHLLVETAETQFGEDSSQFTAVACAWYSVGVLTDQDLDEMNVTACRQMDAGAMDASEAKGNGVPEGGPSAPDPCPLAADTASQSGRSKTFGSCGAPVVPTN